ncbi:nitroreductase [Nemania sp. FL0916]|nr:nitroreductase [Nemania sp. FL0916]
MSSLPTMNLSEAIENRRSLHKLSDDVKITDSQVQDILRHALLHSPSPFNSQTSRTVLLVKDEHKKFWDMAHEVAKAAVGSPVFEKAYEPRIKMFREAYGTILFYDDPTAVEELAKQRPMLKDHLPQWMDHANGMLQYAVWTMLAAEGVGCNLQHYNPMVNARASQEWNIPETWLLKAQMVFGNPASPPLQEKTWLPLEQRLFAHGV